MIWMLFRKSVINAKMLLVCLFSISILVYPFVTGGYFRNEMVFTESVDILSLYAVAFSTSSFVIFAGIFPGIPYAYSYLEERNSGYLKFIQTRMSRKKYAIQKICFSGLSGGMAVLLPTVGIYILMDILSGDTTPELCQSIWEIKIWGPYMFQWGGRFVLMLKAMLIFLFGVMWSELALLIALIVRNKYVAFVLPFLIYEVLWILVPGTYFNPVFLVRADFDQPLPIFVPYLIDVIYIIILVMANWILFRKRERK